MREPRGTEHECNSQRDEVDLRFHRAAVFGSGREHVMRGDLLTRRPRNGMLRRAEDLREVHPEFAEYHEGHDGRARNQQDGLDDLHPRGSLHSADEHVDDHQCADHGDHDRLAGARFDVEEERNEASGARHLRQQIEQGDNQRRDRGGESDGALPQSETQYIRHGELPCVAQQFGNEEECDQPCDEEADGVEEPVVSIDGDGTRDAEEACRREVVTRDRNSVLRAGECSATGEIVRGG